MNNQKIWSFAQRTKAIAKLLWKSSLNRIVRDKACLVCTGDRGKVLRKLHSKFLNSAIAFRFIQQILIIIKTPAEKTK
jgi:hypothetical protein